MRTATEYFAQNCWIGASMPGPRDVEARHAVGVDKFMWGSDYPHDEGSYPETTRALRRAFRDVDHESTAAMLGGNAARLYGFDLDALAPLAQRFGPTVAEVHRPRQPRDDHEGKVSS
jgi:predicted TIM-barrel fold metal-dependent hydrolase